MGAARLYRGPTPGRAWVLADCNVPLGALDVAGVGDGVQLRGGLEEARGEDSGGT